MKEFVGNPSWIGKSCHAMVMQSNLAGMLPSKEAFGGMPDAEKGVPTIARSPHGRIDPSPTRHVMRSEL
mgnify:CR=1 FL=1